jgi:hypothetical protein
MLTLIVQALVDVLSKIALSELPGSVSLDQLAGVFQLLSAPPPSQVRSAAVRGFAAQASSAAAIKGAVDKNRAVGIDRLPIGRTRCGMRTSPEDSFSGIQGVRQGGVG